MNQEDAEFTADYTDSPDSEEIILQLTRSLSETLSKNYNWIRFIAIAEVILVLLDLILSFGTIIIRPMSLMHSILGIISAYYLWGVCREIKRAYRYDNIEAVKKAFNLIGKYFIASALAMILTVASSLFF